MGYSKEEQKWKQRLKRLEVQGKNVWVYTADRVVKLKISRVLPTADDNQERKIINLLKSLSTFSTGGPLGIIPTELIAGKDQKQCNAGFQKAKKNEIDGLGNRKAFKALYKRDITAGSNTLGSRLVLEVENRRTRKSYIARLVVQGYEDCKENTLVQAPAILRQQKIRIIILSCNIGLPTMDTRRGTSLFSKYRQVF